MNYNITTRNKPDKPGVISNWACISKLPVSLLTVYNSGYIMCFLYGNVWQQH